MELGTLIGIALAFVFITLGNVVEGGDPMALFLPAPFIIVIPTTLAIAMASSTMANMPLVIAGAKRSLVTKNEDPSETIELMVRFAEKARREGILALEDALKDVDDEFFKKGVQMAVDGTDPEQLREIMEAEIDAKKKQGKVPAKFFEDCGGYAPTIGIIGTVLGLVHILHNLSDPGSLGPAISSAFIATLLGVGSANVVYLPMGNKLKLLAEQDAHHMEAIVEGVCAIQSGSNPRMIQQKLSAFLGLPETPPKAKRAA